MNYLKLLLVVILVFLFLYLIYTFLLKKPSHNRNWETGFEKLPLVRNINNNSVLIRNVRNWKYSKNDITSFEYIDETYNTKDIENVWFLLEPFGSFKAIAHTYFIFDFKDKDPLAFSIEARREKKEKYNGFSGLFNKYELIYMWGTEKDFTGRRAYKDDETVYMYPLNLSEESKRNLFLQLVEETNNLENKPKFYNTLTSNCTNLLAKFARKINKKSLPIYSLILFPGSSDKLLYDLGYISNSTRFEDVKKKYYITDFVKENYLKEDFSNLLRNYLK